MPKTKTTKATRAPGRPPSATARQADLRAFGLGLRERRLAKGWTLDEASSRMEMDPAQLRRIEVGQAAVTLVTLMRLARAFETRAGDLLAPMESQKSSGSRKAKASHDPDTIGENLARNMARLRARHELTQRDLATQAGVGASVVSATEAGRASPTVKSVALIAAALDTTVEELLR